MKVKDVGVFFDHMYGFDYRILADFYGEDGFYIGHIDRNHAGDMFVSDGVRAVWRNNIKFYRMYTLQETVVFTIVVLKGEENEV